MGEAAGPAAGRSEGRRAYIDVARGLAVIAVVVGHALVGTRVEAVLLSFDLALFFFLSGYLFKEEYALSPGRLVVRRIRTLYVPFVAWGLLYVALHDLLLKLNVYSPLVPMSATQPPATVYGLPGTMTAALRVLTFRMSEPIAGAMWFLTALFMVNLLFCGVSWLTVKAFGSREWARGGLVLALAALGYWGAGPLQNRYYIGTALVALLVFYLGSLYRRFESRVRLDPVIACLAMLLVVAAGGGGVFYGANAYGSLPALLVLPPAGIYACLVLADRLAGSSMLRFIGRNTIPIVAMHLLAFKLVSLAVIAARGYPGHYLARFPVVVIDPVLWVPYAVVGLVVPLVLAWLWERGTAVISVSGDAVPVAQEADVS